MSSQYVLVTGASSGIGSASAMALADRGCHVFAGVRKESDLERIREQSKGKLDPIRLDVTDSGQIADAVDRIKSVVGDAGLWGLVNNAGIGVVGPLEFIPMEDFDRQMRINVYGLLAVTKAFLPLLRLASGRLCLISSTNGFISPAMMGAYSASKYAVEAMGDSLRGELAPLNVRVSLVEPGAIKTPIWDKAKTENEAMLACMPKECTELYGPMIDSFRREAEKMRLSASPASEVADCVAHAITSRRPKTRYRCGSGSRVSWFLARWVPDLWRDWIIGKAMGHMG